MAPKVKEEIPLIFGTRILATCREFVNKYPSVDEESGLQIGYLFGPEEVIPSALSRHHLVKAWEKPADSGSLVDKILGSTILPTSRDSDMSCSSPSASATGALPRRIRSFYSS